MIDYEFIICARYRMSYANNSGKRSRFWSLQSYSRDDNVQEDLLIHRKIVVKA